MLSAISAFDPEKAFGRIELAPRRSVIVAVSGGSDSTALLIAFRRWAGRAHPHLTIVCVTVDHGLRPQSAGEARQVGELCLRLGVAHRILRWTGAKPEKGLPAAAREARYALLAKAAREADTDVILTGHTADDQLETVAMRRARGTGPGLAGMARATLFDGEVWLLRPLLDVTRQTLRKMLGQEGVVWIDDPTNLDIGYERVRVRQRLAADPDRYSQLDTIRIASEARRTIARAAADLIASNAALVAPGLVRLEPAFLATDEAGAEAWRFLLACAGGRTHPANPQTVGRLLERLAKGRSALSGTVVTRKRNAIYLHRERRSDRPLKFQNGVFDGRYRIGGAAADAGWRLRTREADDARPEGLQSGGQEFDAPQSLVRAALAAEPVLEKSGDQINSPRPEILRYLAPFDHFLPEFDLTLADAIAALFGRDRYPRPPVAR